MSRIGTLRTQRDAGVHHAWDDEPHGWILSTPISGAAQTHTIINKWWKGRDSLSRFRKTKPFPVGHPITETEFHASSLERWAQVVVMTYGLAQFRVQPHRDLFEPVLLMRKTNKLAFAFCPMSVDEQLQHPWNEQCPENAPTQKKSDNLSAHDGARNSSWPSRKGITRCGILYHARVKNTTIRGKVQTDGWPSRQIGEDPGLHANRLREYLSRTLTASKKFWPPQPLKTHGQQFLGQV